jgi:hypothetical protein
VRWTDCPFEKPMQVIRKGYSNAVLRLNASVSRVVVHYLNWLNVVRYSDL